MKKMSETILFFGSGPVAAASLDFLRDNFTIEAVITKSTPVHHKGSVPILELAQAKEMPTFFANNQQELDELIKRESFKSRVGVIVDFGVIVSTKTIDAFPLGVVNSHFSLLPEWRGADPITFTILSGQRETGVSLMLIVDKLDEGQLLAQEKLVVPERSTTPELTKALITKSNEMLVRYLPDYVSGRLKPYDQPGRVTSYSRKLAKEDGVIDWTKPAVQIEREIRAFIDWPKSRTTLNGKDVIITKAYVVPGTAPGSKPGNVTIVSEAKAIAIATSNGSLWIDRLKPAGKNEMTAREFLLGYGKSL